MFLLKICIVKRITFSGNKPSESYLNEELVYDGSILCNILLSIIELKSRMDSFSFMNKKKHLSISKNTTGCSIKVLTSMARLNKCYTEPLITF